MPNTITSGTTPLGSTPPDVAGAQRQLKALQWAIPGLTGAVLASSSLHEEQQRPSEVLKGTIQGLPSRAAALGAGIMIPAALLLALAHSHLWLGLPLLIAPDGAKLSKRKRSISRCDMRPAAALRATLGPFRRAGLLPDYPLGCDFTVEEQRLVRALAWLRSATCSRTRGIQLRVWARVWTSVISG